MRPSLRPSTASHLSMTFCATSASIAGVIGASVNAFWFHIAPIVKPV